MRVDAWEWKCDQYLLQKTNICSNNSSYIKPDEKFQKIFYVDMITHNKQLIIQ